MTTYAIDKENSFTAFASAKEATSKLDAERFSSTKELARLADKWPAPRLMEIWNTLPGVTPVKKFTSRKKGVFRIWAAIQSLDPNAGERRRGRLSAPTTEMLPPVPAKAARRPGSSRCSGEREGRHCKS